MEELYENLRDCTKNLIKSQVDRVDNIKIANNFRALNPLLIEDAQDTDILLTNMEGKQKEI
jgi:hypothetical protein